MSVNEPVNAPWRIWLCAVLAAASFGVAAVLYRRTRAQEETIRRQLARDTARKARFDELFDRSSEILVVHDRRGRVSTINRSGEEALGYLREEIRMLDAGWIFGADYMDAVADIIREGPESSPRTLRSEMVPHQGNRVPVEVHVRALIGGRQVVGVAAIGRNLSEHHRLENELRQAQKMEAVGRLATGIAHDVNNIITALLGYSDALIEEAPPDSSVHSSVHSAAVEVRRAADRASALTQRLLAFSRRQASISHSVDVNNVVAHMEDLVRRLIGPEIKLECSLDPELALISADSQQIGQVLMNLVVNARDLMPKGGTLTIETANVELGTEQADVIPGPHMLLSLRDSGAAMSREIRERLFEPFVTTKESAQGTGRGLSMADAIVRQSSGDILVERAPNQGTTVMVYFPRHADPSAAPMPVPTPSSGVTVKGEGTILLAEDDRSVRRGLKILFISGYPECAGAGLDPAGVTNLLMKSFTADALAARVKALITGRKEADGRSV